MADRPAQVMVGFIDGGVLAVRLPAWAVVSGRFQFDLPRMRATCGIDENRYVGKVWKCLLEQLKTLALQVWRLK